MKTSFKYGNSLYSTLSKCSRAAVEDFMYAGGNNSLVDVAAMDPKETVAEIESCGWEVPGYYWWSASELITMAAEIISEAKEAGESRGLFQ